MNGCQEKPKSRPLLARAFGSKKPAASPGAQLLTTEGDAVHKYAGDNELSGHGLPSVEQTNSADFDFREGDLDLWCLEITVYQHCFLAVPLKTTNEVDLIKPLTKFFEASSSTICVNVADLRGAIEAFNRLRSNACSKQTRDPQLLLASIAEYYDQLTAFEGKLVTLASPRLEGFRWRDAFESGKSFLGKIEVGETDRIAAARLPMDTMIQRVPILTKGWRRLLICRSNLSG